MRTITIAFADVQAQLDRAVSLVHTAPRFAAGSTAHRIADYAAQYAADQAELASEMAANPYTRSSR